MKEEKKREKVVRFAEGHDVVVEYKTDKRVVVIFRSVYGSKVYYRLFKTREEAEAFVEKKRMSCQIMPYVEIHELGRE